MPKHTEKTTTNGKDERIVESTVPALSICTTSESAAYMTQSFVCTTLPKTGITHVKA